ncbi:hypothetical protein MRB53_038257 [Persea americana]|nr:hypothetical protein MRB53_038257 [Persea americana]
MSAGVSVTNRSTILTVRALRHRRPAPEAGCFQSSAPSRLLINRHWRPDGQVCVRIKVVLAHGIRALPRQPPPTACLAENVRALPRHVPDAARIASLERREPLLVE